jgi:putative membrane protein
MKRLTLDVLLAGTLALAPMALAQDNTSHGLNQNRMDSPTRQGPSDLPPAELPPTPSSTTTGSERAGNQPVGNQPIDTSRPAATNDVADGDLNVVRQVHEANQKEIEMGQMAADKAKSGKVKSYARKLIDDHKAFDRQLMSYASKKGLESRLQQTAAGTDVNNSAPAESDMHARLAGETGSEFDHDFAATMVDEHDKAIQMVRSARDSVSDPELRTLLGNALPKLEKHRKMAQDLVDKSKV